MGCCCVSPHRLGETIRQVSILRQADPPTGDGEHRDTGTASQEAGGVGGGLNLGAIVAGQSPVLPS